MTKSPAIEWIRIVADHLGDLRGDAESQRRLPTIVQRMKRIAGR